MKQNIFTEDSINVLQSAINNNLIDDLVKYKFAERFSIKIGRIYVKYANNEVIIDLNDYTNKEYMKIWRNSVAKIFINDIKHENLDNYYITSYNGIYYLLKRVTEDEDVKIIDNKYKVISISSNDKFSNNVCNIKYELEDANNENDNDEDINNEDIELVSLELFNEEDLV